MRPEDDDVTPMMWPPSGSGFEASPYSPAGELQGLSRFGRGAAGDRSSRPLWVRVTLWVVVVAVLLPFAVTLGVTVWSILT